MDRSRALSLVKCSGMNSRVSGHIEDIPGRAISVKSFQVGLWSNGRDTAD